MERLNDIISRATQRRQQSPEQQRPAHGTVHGGAHGGVHGGVQGGYPYGSPRQPQGQRSTSANQPAQPVHPAQQHHAPAMPQIPPTPIVQQSRQMPAYRPTRPLSEQMTPYGQKGSQQGQGGQSGLGGQSAPNAYPSNYTQQAPPNRARYTPEEPGRSAPQIAPHLSQTATRPTQPHYPRQQRLVPKTPSAPPLRQQERGSTPARSPYYAREQADSLPSTYARNDYHTNDYHAPLPSDVLEEEEDEEVGMQYGDWEDDSNDTPMYEQVEPETHAPGVSSAPGAPASRHTYTPTPAVYEPYAPYASEVDPRSPQQQHAQEMQRPASAQHAPITRIQEVPNYHHKTQSLNPVGARFTAPTPDQQPSRQLITREALTPMPTTTQITTKTVCPKCKGAGYRRADVPFGHPNFGKPIACECKEAERKEKRRQQLIELSDLSAFHDKHFDNFSTRFPGIHPSITEAWKEAYHFAQNPEGWLIFIGTNGCGKTHLAAAIANQCLNDGMMVLFSVVPELLDHLRGAFAPTATQVYDQLFSKMREAELLVLDDLGAHYSTPWATEKLYQLLNYRYSWRMPTVITTNNVGLQSIDIRLSSRMMDSSLVMVVNLEHAKDRRPYLARRDM